MKRGIVSLGFILLLVLGSVAVLSPKALAAPGPYYAVEPSYLEFGPEPCEGQEFTVAVWLHNVTDQNVPAGVFGVEIKLQWDPDYLQLKRVVLHIGESGGVLNPPTFNAKNESTTTTKPDDTWWIASSSLAGADPWFGDGRVADFTFKIIKQPKEILGESDVTIPLALVFTDLVDSTGSPVVHGPNVDGSVVIYPQPYEYPPEPTVEVRPPEYKARSLGETFDVAVYITAYNETTGEEVGVDSFWDVSGFDVTLFYDPTLIWPVAITEGDFLKSSGMSTWGWIENDTDNGRIWAVYTMLGPEHVPVSGSGNLLVITFEVIYESETYPPPECDLDLYDVHLASWPHPERLMPPWEGKPYAVELPIAAVVDGHYEAPFKPPGAWIDLYTQYPEPYGGQGPNQHSDSFAPQMLVCLFANVTYNNDPVANKWVLFEVHNALGEKILVRGNYTDKNGIAWICFRIPMPDTNLGGEPPDIFGEWWAIATVELDEKMVNDTITFMVGWLFKIKSVTPVESEYDKYGGVPMEFVVEYECIFEQGLDAIVAVDVYDEPGYPIGEAFFSGHYQAERGDTGVVPLVGSTTVSIPIPSWARVGQATVFANAFNDWPRNGGTAYCPEVSASFGIIRP